MSTIPAKTLRGSMAGRLGLALLGAALGLAPALAQDAPPAMAMGSGRMVRGTVTEAAADHLTVKTETGDVYVVVVTPNTRIAKGRDPVKLADVHAGDGVGAMGELDPAKKTVHALMLMVVDAEQLKKAREAMGKTFISGTVTAIDEVKITIKRTDEVVQVIEVDEDTSFRKGGQAMQLALAANPSAGMMGGFGGGRGQRQGGDATSAAATQDSGESVTLADVKVGNLVAGTGTLKNGVFVPKMLAIGDAAAPRQRRRPDGAGAPGTPPATPPPTTTPASQPPASQRPATTGMEPK